ncbi:MAG TPA: hypothetical protein VFB82_10875 [Blastocatellia bacterium]|jgi:hypothetical protein|nr:hypothetical protein [Blastocatellia bacterium]
MPTRPDRFPILQSRPDHDSINSVTRAQKDFAALHLTPEQKKEIDRWLEVEFTCAALALEGVMVTQEEVARVAESAPASGGDVSGQMAEICAALKSIRLVISHVDKQQVAALLTPALLVELHGGVEPGQSTLDACASSQATRDHDAHTRLIAKLDSACHWFSAESFVELHAAEQAAIVLMRVIELRPFNDGVARMALAASSLFTLRSGLPPVIISSNLQIRYQTALREGMKMNTRPMVDLVAEALVTTVSEIVGRVRSK